MSLEIFERLRLNAPQMSPTFRRIAEFIARHYADVAFMPASQLAAECDTHESAVVKFAVSLGYSGYPEMLREIQRATKGTMEPAAEDDEEVDPDFARYRASILASAEALARARQQGLAAPFKALVEAARQANRTYVVGVNGQASLALQVNFQLDALGYRVTTVTDGGIGLFKKLRGVDEGDLLIAFSYPPYLRPIRQAVELAAGRKAVTAVVTDRADAPVAEAATLVLATGSDDTPLRLHLTCATALIGALGVALALSDRERALASVKALDDLLGRFHVHTP